jgi:pyridoxal phosphate-dependent aminotransferase EpsN
MNSNSWRKPLRAIGSVNPVLYQGAEPVFIDAEPESWNISPSALEQAFLDAEKTKKFPKAVIIVNLYGQSANMTPLLAICDRYGVSVVEDAAESIGATYKGKASGTFGFDDQSRAMQSHTQSTDGRSGQREY